MKQDVTVGFRRVDETAAPEFFIKFLDDCAQLESVRICKAKMSSLLDVSEGESVLDIGCGLGPTSEAWPKRLDRAVGSSA